MKRGKFYFSLAVLFFCLSFISASNVSVWQGQYYTGTSFNTGTYSFNFTVYDELTGGDVCFTNTTSLTTGYWGQWKTEQSPWSLCNNASKEYYLNINIDGSDQTPRRRLVVSDFLRRDVEVSKEGNLEVTDNVTASYFFGDGSNLVGVNGSGDINSVQGDNVYLYNGSDSGNVVLALNESKLNSTIDLRASGLGDNSSWNESYADGKYILQSDEGTLNVNSSVYSNSTTWWSSLTSWLSGWFVNNGGQLEFNETKLNATIDLRDSDTTYSHLSNFTDDLGDRGYTHLSNFTDDLGHVEDNSSWNESYADTKYLQNESDPLWTGNVSNVAFTNVEETFEGNVTVEGIKLEGDSVNHRIYDNSTCIVIQGDTSTMYIC